MEFTNKNLIESWAFRVCLIVALALSVFVTCVLPGCQINEANDPSDTSDNISFENTGNSLPNVVVLTTGGTIAGSGEEGKSTGYKSGSVSGDSLVDSVPQISNYANIKTEEICNVNSDDISDEIWIKLTKRINELSSNPSINGFVVTHGTDTMEETAYFLNLTVKTDKPVIITGSMRPSTAVSADGPSNLLESVKVAANDDAKGKGVQCVFSDLIYSARTFSKVSSYAVNAMSSVEAGALGIVRDDGIYYFHEPAKKHTINTEFDVSNASKLPTVDTVYFDVDADAGLLKTTIDHTEGIVISGAGAGEYSLAFKNVLEKNTKPVFLTGHTGSNSIVQESTILPNKVVACNFLTPQKAKVLLRLALLMNKNPSFDELKRIAAEY